MRFPRYLFATLLLTQIAYCAKPKLVVAIIIDQFRYDYLMRFRTEFHGGLETLLAQGAVFTDANYAQVPTVTAVGHSIFLSGAMPATSGIVGNSWFDRETKSQVTSVCDWNEKVVGGETPQRKPKACTDADPGSPRRLLVTTVGDELKADDPKSVVVGISMKPRAAILPAGHLANSAFWFDDESGAFVTSTFYTDKLPAWAQSFNDRKPGRAYLNKAWPGLPSMTAKWYGEIADTPWGNDLEEMFAEAAVKGERLGQRGSTDILTVSFSANDHIGHHVGPYAPEVHEVTVHTDQVLAQFFKFLDQTVGLRNVLIVLSADHGVAPVPVPKGQGEYVKPRTGEIVNTALNSRFGEAQWVNAVNGEWVYLDHDVIAQHHAPVADVYEAARQALLADPELHVARVYDRSQLLQGLSGDFIAQAAQNGFNQRRSGDLVVILESGVLPNAGKSGTSHSTPWNYDRHVPVIFMGPGIRAGVYQNAITPNDIAPTLAAILQVQTPSGSSGRILTEMLH